jgi:hypothetical protein
MSTQFAVGERVSVFGRGYNHKGVVTMAMRGYGLVGDEQYCVHFDGAESHSGPIYLGEITKEES